MNSGISDRPGNNTVHQPPLTRSIITLSGQCSGPTRPIFEIYRAAVQHGMKGSVRKSADESLVITIEAVEDEKQLFMSWLTNYARATGFSLKCVESEKLMRFTGFLIAAT